ncbi:hypothetical protein D3C76_1031150 [compost metagenome]
MTNTCVRIDNNCTRLSIKPNTCVCWVRLEKCAATKRACSKYKNVLTLANSTTNNAIPSKYGEPNTSLAPAKGFPPSGLERGSSMSAGNG